MRIVYYEDNVFKGLVLFFASRSEKRNMLLGVFCTQILVPPVSLYVCQCALNLFEVILPLLVFEFYVLT